MKMGIEMGGQVALLDRRFKNRLRYIMDEKNPFILYWVLILPRTSRKVLVSFS